MAAGALHPSVHCLLQIYSWSESARPFQQLGLSRAVVEQLNDSLNRLRHDIDHELRLLGPM
jgi:hypothetical protein